MEIGDWLEFTYRKTITMVSDDGPVKGLSEPFRVFGKVVKVRDDYFTLDLGERFPKWERYRSFNTTDSKLSRLKILKKGDDNAICET